MRSILLAALLFLSSTPARADTAQVDIYVTSACPYCQLLEQYLRFYDVSYVRWDIRRSREGAKRFEELGGGGVPLIQIGSTILRGFEPLTLTSVLKRYGLWKPNTGRRSHDDSSRRPLSLH